MADKVDETTRQTDDHYQLNFDASLTPLKAFWSVANDEGTCDNQQWSESSTDPEVPNVNTDKCTSYNRSERIWSDFSEHDSIGQGAYGKVLKARHNIDGKYYAIKCIRIKKNNGFEKVLSEVRHLSNLKHPNVVRYHTSWIEDANSSNAHNKISENSSGQSTASTNTHGTDYNSSDSGFVFREYALSSLTDESDNQNNRSSDQDQDARKSKSLHPANHLYIQMEYCDRTLEKAIDDGLCLGPAEKIWSLFKQIVTGLSHVHENNLLHRDLKCKNIFLDCNDNIKIGDFGMATLWEKTDLVEECSNHTSIVGTSLYVAPEILSGKGSYCDKSDIYSIGIILFEMWYEFKTKHERITVLKKLREKSIEFPQDSKMVRLRPQADLIKKCLNHQTEMRLSACDILQLLPVSETLDAIIIPKTSPASVTLTENLNRSRTPIAYNVYPKVDVGIFNHEMDDDIGEKLKEKFEGYKYSVILYKHVPGSGSRIDKTCWFMKNSKCMVWVATPNSIKDKAYCLRFFHMADHYATLCFGKYLVRPFIVLQPEKYLNDSLPFLYDTYPPLKENNDFENIVRYTLSEIFDKLPENFDFEKLSILDETCEAESL